MNRSNLNSLYKRLAYLALGILLAAPQLASAALSISQVPLFITISMPPNILLLLDDSGSLQWGHVPDWLGETGTATVYVESFAATKTTVNTTANVVVTPVVNNGTVTSTANIITSSVIVATGSVNHGTVTATCTGSVHRGTCNTGTYNYTCSSGYILNGPLSGSSSSPTTTTCTQQTYNYSCASGYTLNGSSSGTSSTAPSGTTCQQVVNYTYSCASGYTLSGSSTGSTSTPPSSTTCTQQAYTYSCPTGYTLSGSSSGTSSTAPSGDSCTASTTTYTCPTGATSSGSGSSTTCAGWDSFGATLDIPNDSTSGGVYAPDTNHYKCACFDPLYYDPTQTYLPGYSDTGTLLSTSFTAAYVNGYNPSLLTIDLATSYEATIDYNPSTNATTLTSSTSHDAFGRVTDEQNSCNGIFTYSGSGTPACQTVHNPQAAFYYILTPTSTSAVANGCGTHTYMLSGTQYTVPTNEDDSCLTKVVVSSTSGPGGTDERQNFANWYSFYRTRNLTVNTSANRAFEGLNPNYRVAWRDLNTCSTFASTGCQGWNGSSYDNRIAAFTGTHKQAFYDWLANYPANGGTPLRTALETMGTYYQTSGTNSPYAFNPQVTDTPEYVCRPNYAVIMTDGLWNDSTIPTSVGNADDTVTTLPDGTTFPANTYPYADSNSNSLADIAFHYWSTNLRPDLGLSTSLQFMPYTKNVTVTDSVGNTANVIPYWNPQNDPASWAHMVTFTIGLGMTVTITDPVWGGSTYAGGYNNLITGNVAWPAVSSNSSNNVYDLWHAALDGRGQFFSADYPQDVQQAFNTIVNRIQGRVGSSSAIAVNSTRLDSNTYIYQAQFNSSNWTGEVLAYSINSSGSVNTTSTWQASANIPAAASRNILTWNETLNSNVGGGTTFQWANLSATEQADLNQNINDVPDTNGQLRLNYLRGDQSEEQDQSGGIFRIRTSILGDIVDSNPEYVGGQNFGFDSSALAEGASYDTFIATKASRTYPHMLYVGGNDAMLHGIDADNGHEIFDYIPRGVYANISALPDPLYTHEFFVDGSPTSVDAYVGGAWKTLVVATTGAGAKEVFILDVTDASNMTGTQVLWDYDGVDGSSGSIGTAYSAAGGTSNITLPDPNMGYTINEPTIVRMHDGDWYALFGNGYNSTNQQAVIYLYNLNTQTLYTYSTGVGSSTTPNGMSSPSPVDYNGDRITDAIYAGDLLGNVWKLDVSGSTPSSWKFTTYGNPSATPLFTAHDGSGNVQPITDRPQVGKNSSGQVMVFFGTGTYFLSGDNSVGSNPPVMSAYGIIDDLGNTASDQVKGTSSTDRSELLAQYIVTTDTINGTLYRITTSYAMTSSDKGWYIDLLTPPTGSATVGTAQGERVVSDAVLDLGRIVFTTLIPQGNACQYGGESFLMELDENSGGALSSSPFDTNGDGVVNSQDMVTVSYYDPASGKNVTMTVAVSGQQSNVGIIKTPGIIASGQLQYKYYSGSTGAIGVTTEKGSDASQRISWQQLQ